MAEGARDRNERRGLQVALIEWLSNPMNDKGWLSAVRNRRLKTHTSCVYDKGSDLSSGLTASAGSQKICKRFALNRLPNLPGSQQISPLLVMLNFHGQILVNKTYRLSSFTVDWNAPTHVESKRQLGLMK
ncbi:hypothetical protein GOP47_0009444 [Adiantum capillus-veneris]|uniref:Uncharacterized protein n=1 Tax=Adiantum capillus-veneris TaxID=13818 RepID=A0A9D4ZH68_ADICA|nr:hypothetical protein GOP47_0009444 [Adiantum capillus-veneris]